MKTITLAAMVAICSAAFAQSGVLTVVLRASSSTQLSAGKDASFDAALAQVEAAQIDLVRGLPDAFKALWSHRDDVTLTGGLGGAIEKGWPNVSRRLDWVSSQYTDGTREHEEIARIVGQDVAYVVQKEVIHFRVPGQNARVTQELRAVMVFRLESGAWRISHRQADSQTIQQPTR